MLMLHDIALMMLACLQKGKLYNSSTVVLYSRGNQKKKMRFLEDSYCWTWHCMVNKPRNMKTLLDVFRSHHS